MPKEIDISEYVDNSEHPPIIDVRSPGEFEHGKINGAYNIPLFTNEERAKVGTVYKKNSREEAIALGKKIVSPKLDSFIKESRKIAPDGKVAVHCWRGGMRSRAFAIHLKNHGFKEVLLIKGGYKAYRKLVLDSFTKKSKLFILGGFTGSGKTELLKTMAQNGEQVIDLEGIANHKGSAFGGIDSGKQPTVEQFENNLFVAWNKMDLSKPIWLEDESHNIGRVKIPMNLFSKMRESTLFFLSIPKENRAGFLVGEYGNCDKNALKESISRISKRLGDQNARKAMVFIDEGNLYDAIIIVLGYYDKYYLKGMRKRDQEKVISLFVENTDKDKNYFVLKEYLSDN